jgi:hypothetical protein
MASANEPFQLTLLEELEYTHGIFKITTYGIAPWELARWEVARTLLRELTGAGAAHDTPEGVSMMLRAGMRTVRMLLRRIALKFASADICVFGHPRRQRGPDGRWWDIYCDPLFADGEVDVAHLEFSDFLTHRRPPGRLKMRYLTSSISQVLMPRRC